jgi:fatty acid desaturase
MLDDNRTSMSALRRVRLLPVCACALCLAAVSVVIYSQDWWTPALVMIGAAACLAYMDRTDRMSP